MIPPQQTHETLFLLRACGHRIAEGVPLEGRDPAGRVAAIAAATQTKCQSCRLKELRASRTPEGERARKLLGEQK